MVRDPNEITCYACGTRRSEGAHRPQCPATKSGTAQFERLFGKTGNKDSGLVAAIRESAVEPVKEYLTRYPEQQSAWCTIGKHDIDSGDVHFIPVSPPSPEVRKWWEYDPTSDIQACCCDTCWKAEQLRRAKI